jgi:protease-4
MLRFVRLVFALLLAQVLLLVLGIGLVSVTMTAYEGAPSIESGSVLWVQLQGEIVEYPTLPTVPFLRHRPLSQTAILEALDEASRDDRITAVLLDIDDPWIGWGKAAELHEAILRFRESKKQVVAYADDLDELGYYVASACDSIYLPPTGKLYLNGMGVGPMYYRGALDKLGIRPNISRIGAYKDAPEPELRTSMSRESREQFEWILDGLWTEFLETVSSSRNLGRADLEEALEEGILQPDDAADRGFIDGVSYLENLVTRYVDDINDTRLVPVLDYHQARAPRRRHGSQTIAMVHARGLILRGRNEYNPGVGTILGSSSVVRDLETAAADDNIAAIVLRVDSPGGEITASDIISNAVERARETKPVVVSMVDVAASGGYMISFHANKVVALPTTLTGSIGMFSGKLNLHGLYNKLGLTRDFVTRGSFPFLESDYHDWSAAEESLITRQQWEDYDRWIKGIAANRKLAPGMVDQLGRGRVWTGQQAHENGLVDELGGESTAIQVAQELAGIPESVRPRIVHYPEEKNFLELLLEEDGDLVWAGAVEHWARSLRLPRISTWSVLDLHFLP